MSPFDDPVSFGGVRQERTGWRDQDISARHRTWGMNCPAVDLDFLMVEYNIGEPVALVEYKHYLARFPDFRHPTYRALTMLADRGEPLPFLLAFYWPDCWAFRVDPINDTAKEWFGSKELLSEYEYVHRLYEMRGRQLESYLDARLNIDLPPIAERLTVK